MSSILDPLVSDATQPVVCRIVRQFDSDVVIYAFFDDAEFQQPQDISAWGVSVVDVERRLCRIVDGPAIQGPYKPFAPPAILASAATTLGIDAPAAAADFAVTRPAPNAYAVAYPPNAWPWPIAAHPLSRQPTDPLLVVRIALDKGAGVVQRAPLLLAFRSEDLDG